MWVGSFVRSITLYDNATQNPPNSGCLDCGDLADDQCDGPSIPVTVTRSEDNVTLSVGTSGNIFSGSTPSTGNCCEAVFSEEYYWGSEGCGGWRTVNFTVTDDK
jgi:hypothetical protein